MSSYPTNIYFLRNVNYYCDQPVVITFDIEYNSVITNIICIQKIPFQLVNTRPTALGSFLVPLLQSYFTAGVFGIIVNDFLFADNSHTNSKVHLL